MLSVSHAEEEKPGLPVSRHGGAISVVSHQVHQYCGASVMCRASCNTWVELLPHHSRGSLGHGVLLSFLNIWPLGSSSLPKRQCCQKTNFSSSSSIALGWSCLLLWEFPPGSWKVLGQVWNTNEEISQFPF